MSKHPYDIQYVKAPADCPKSIKTGNGNRIIRIRQQTEMVFLMLTLNIREEEKKIQRMETKRENRRVNRY